MRVDAVAAQISGEVAGNFDRCALEGQSAATQQQRTEGRP